MRPVHKPSQYSVTTDKGLTKIENTTTKDFLNAPVTYIHKRMTYKDLIDHITGRLYSRESGSDIMYSDTTMYECDILWCYLLNSMVCVSVIYNEDNHGSLVYSHKIIDTTTPSHQLIKNTQREVVDRFDRNEVTIYKMDRGETYHTVLTKVFEDIEDNVPIQSKGSQRARITPINRTLMPFSANKFYKFDKATGTLQYMEHRMGTPTEEIFNRHAKEIIVPVRTGRDELTEIIKAL
jgi:hypothetical protein